jgi:hypothetical protein
MSGKTFLRGQDFLRVVILYSEVSIVPSELEVYEFQIHFVMLILIFCQNQLGVFFLALFGSMVLTRPAVVCNVSYLVGFFFINCY